MSTNTKEEPSSAEAVRRVNGFGSATIVCGRYADGTFGCINTSDWTAKDEQLWEAQWECEYLLMKALQKNPYANVKDVDCNAEAETTVQQQADFQMGVYKRHSHEVVNPDGTHVISTGDK